VNPILISPRIVTSKTLVSNVRTEAYCSPGYCSGVEVVDQGDSGLGISSICIASFEMVYHELGSSRRSPTISGFPANCGRAC
jgi:hypothetical protein